MALQCCERQHGELPVSGKYVMLRARNGRLNNGDEARLCRLDTKSSNKIPPITEPVCMTAYRILRYIYSVVLSGLDADFY